MGTDDLKYWFALKFVDGIGSLTFRALIDRFGSPRKVFSAPLEEIRTVAGKVKKAAENIKGFHNWEKAEREIYLAEKSGVSILTYIDPGYPRALLNIYDFPPILYIRGEIRHSDTHIAMVGSRAASAYGKYAAERLSRELAYSGATVVSGLARGIDAAAHRGALAARGRTIAVLGCGIDIIYPPENRDLYERIPASGAIVTEFPFGTAPIAANFPERNRIISGLSLGVVVIEATEKSGSLITAGMALEQGREVFAVPGVIDSPGSKGTHKLLKQGAKLVENVTDIFEEILPQAQLHFDASGAPATRTGTLPEREPGGEKELPLLSACESALLEALSRGPLDVDTIISRTGLQAGEALGILTGLELRGQVAQLPGKMFSLKTD